MFQDSLEVLRPHTKAKIAQRVKKISSSCSLELLPIVNAHFDHRSYIAWVIRTVLRQGVTTPWASNTPSPVWRVWDSKRQGLSSPLEL